MILRNVTVGADPELFIINEETGKVVSAVGLIPGEKGNPYVADDMPAGFGMETDNIVAEFNIPPATTTEAFVNNIEYMKNYLDRFVKDINPELGIKCSASEFVDEDQLQSPQAKLFGCDVDYNVYTEEPNPKPKGNSTNLRSCGFHIHLGYDNNNIDTSLLIVKYLDAFLGVPSVLLDNDKNRRSLYGKAGCFRLTPYGVEYRVLSSAMMSTTERISFTINCVQNALKALSSGYSISSYTKLIISAINNSDAAIARRLVNELGIKVCVD